MYFQSHRSRLDADALLSLGGKELTVAYFSHLVDIRSTQQ